MPKGEFDPIPEKIAMADKEKAGERLKFILMNFLDSIRKVNELFQIEAAPQTENDTFLDMVVKINSENYIPTEEDYARIEKEYDEILEAYKREVARKFKDKNVQ